MEAVHLAYAACLHRMSCRQPYKYKGSRSNSSSSSKQQGEVAAAAAGSAAGKLGVLLSGALEKRGKAGVWTSRFFTLVAGAAADVGNDR